MTRQEIEALVGQKIRNIRFQRGRFLYQFENVILESPKIDDGKAKWIRLQDGQGEELEKFRINLLGKMLEGNTEMVAKIRGDGEDKK